MSPNVDIKSHGEVTLVDWVRIFGALIFVALMCFCIVLLARGTNQLATTQAEALLRVPTPAVSSQPPRSKSTPEADAKSVTTTTQRESYHIAFVSPSADTSSKVPSITLLSRIVDFLRECGVAVGTVSGRSQQPRPDRFQDLLQRQTRSFFLPQGRRSG